MPGGQKSFILGVGAQKSGTTWMHYYLATSPNVATTNIKEYHVWDALTIPCCKSKLVSVEESRLDEVRNLQYMMQQSTDFYFQFFEDLLKHTDRPITCDISPSYTGLSTKTLTQIKNGFEKRNIQTKAILLMRDPVERCWSAARMMSRKANGHMLISDDEVLAWAKSEPCEMRTSYHHTINALQSVFTPSKNYIGLFEEMHRPEQLVKLSAFCDVPLRPEFTDFNPNKNPKTTEIGIETIKEIVAFYRHVYEFVASRFPQAEKLWGGYKYL